MNDDRVPSTNLDYIHIDTDAEHAIVPEELHWRARSFSVLLIERLSAAAWASLAVISNII